MSANDRIATVYGQPIETASDELLQRFARQAVTAIERLIERPCPGATESMDQHWRVLHDLNARLHDRGLPELLPAA